MKVNLVPEITRREVIARSALGGLGAFASLGALSALASETAAPSEDFRATGKRVKQSVMAWCLNSVPKETLIPACSQMGLVAMEGIDPKFYPLMKEHGLGVSLCGSHGFTRGPLSSDNRKFCVEKLRDAIDLAVKWNAPNVITFTGMREKGITDNAAIRNCVDCWKEVIGYAEQNNINLVLEQLNSRDDSHPMKGHPGYFGDDIELCIDLIRQVDSPRMKFLFDIYHVQIMNGDVIRRFRQYHDLVGHVHTAGVPGRGELDETQELNYPAIIRAIHETGYDGFVTQEFIPTWEDKLAALRHGVMVCDI